MHFFCVQSSPIIATNIDYVIVKCDEGESYRVAIQPHWRSLPNEEGFILFKHKIFELCGFHVDKVRDLKGIVITSLKTIATAETVCVVPSIRAPSCGKKEERKEVCSDSKAENSPPCRHKQLEAKIDVLVSRVDKLQERVRIPVAPNLIKNSLMQSVQPNGAPTGYAINSWNKGGDITCTAVHPFTHGFEGCYTKEAPANSVIPAECALAKAGRPVFYGVYNMGSRLSRGGLSTGWMCITDGHILKLEGTRIDKHETSINLPVMKVGATSFVRFIAWIKCVRGCIGFGVDYPNWNKPANLFCGKRRPGFCRPQDCEGAPQGWFLLDDVIVISNITRLYGGHSFLLRCFGPRENGGLGGFEIYVALPYASLVEASGKITIAGSVSEW